MLSQLSYFPTWAPQRGVAWYVCHSCAGVKSFLRAARPAAGGMAAVTGRAGLPRGPAPPGERLPLVLRLLADPARPGASRRKGKRLPARGRGARATCRARDARRFPRSALLADAGRIHAGAPAKRQCRARASRQATSARARAPGGLPGIAFLRPCAAKKSAGPPLWGLATAKKNAIEAR